jgi:hypothetical protein
MEIRLNLSLGLFFYSLLLNINMLLSGCQGEKYIFLKEAATEAQGQREMVADGREAQDVEVQKRKITF